MRTIVGTAAAAVLSLSALSACGGGDGTSRSSGGYCDDVRSVSASLTALTENSISQQDFEKLLDTLRAIRDEAPSGVKDDWAALSAAADSFRTALDKAGMDMTDLQSMQHGNMASGRAMDTVMSAAGALSSLRVANARAAIATQAKKACDVDLST